MSENTEKKEYNITKALDHISKGASINNASKQFDIPYSTLYRTVKKITRSRKKGRIQILTKDIERELLLTVSHLSVRGFGLTKPKVIKLATEIALLVNPKHTISLIMKTLSDQWWKGFKKRNPNLQLRKPTKIDLARVEMGENEDAILSFYSEYETLNQKYHYDPDQVWNMDETGSTQKETPHKIVSTKGERNVGVRESINGNHTTIVACVNANGATAPPLFIFSGMMLGKNDIKSAPKGAWATTTLSGYISSDIFDQWMVKWIEWVRATTSKPLLLLLDNHSTHLSWKSIKLAKENHIDIISLPPHLTQVLQPLDVSVFRSLKAVIRRNLSTKLSTLGTNNLNNEEFVDFVSEYWDSVFSKSNIMNGFANVGLFPFNPNAIFDRIQIALLQKQQIDIDIDNETTKTDTNTNLEINNLKSEVAKLKMKVESMEQEHKSSTRRKKRHRVIVSQVLTSDELEAGLMISTKVKKAKYRKKQKMDIANDTD